MTDRSRGTFITFEGTDGSGKSTQMKLLADRLRQDGLEVIETQEPGGTEIGRQIRRILLNSENHALCPTAEMLLYFAARAQNFDERILPAWDRGAVVLSDRFTDSTLAYQGEGRGIGPNIVMTLHDIACHGLQPDLTIYIDIDLETSLERAGKRTRDLEITDRMEQQAGDFYVRVRDAYLKLARQNKDRIRIVDGRGTVEKVAERIHEVISPVLKGRAYV